MNLTPQLAERAAAPTPTAENDHAARKVHAPRLASVGRVQADTREQKQRSPVEGNTPTNAERRQTTADALEEMLMTRFLAGQTLDTSDAVWIKRAVRQLRETTLDNHKQKRIN